MCRLRAADSTKKMPGGVPKTEGAEHLCLSHKHRPQGWILQLIQKFLHVAAQFMNYQAGEWDDGCHKQWEHRKAVWHGKNSLESMVAPCTGGCRVEGSLRRGAQTPAHSGTNPTFNPTAQGHLQSSLQILQRSWFTLWLWRIFSFNAITPFPVMVLLFIKKTIDNHRWCGAGGVINPPYQTQLRKLLVTHNSFSF